jgi:hypothetical protein
MAMLLTREQILKKRDLPREKVDVPEWGGTVMVRALTGAERDAFEQSIVDTRGKSAKANLANIRAKLCARCIVDDAGTRVLDDGDALSLGEQSANALQRVFNVAQRLNGMSPSDVEELAKNSKPGPSDGSTSD